MLIRFVASFNLLTVCVFAQILSELSNYTSDVEHHGKTEILSRKKRFLIFPEGSSVQLVFCNTFPSISSIAGTILWGYTSALAYELPQDPYSPFDHHADPLHRRGDTKEIFYLNEDGKIIYKRPYKHRKLIVNPAFAKRSIDSVPNDGDEDKIDRKQMHQTHKRNFLKDSQRTTAFHRSSRAVLYRKIETMLNGLGNNGRECMLKTLCLIRQTKNHPQGLFVEEIIRAVFTLPKGRIEESMEYDIPPPSTQSSSSCDILYPDCNQHAQDITDYVPL